MGRLSVAFDQQCFLWGLPKPVAEHKFHPTRKWRFDFAFLEPQIAIEIDGGGYVNGRHSRGSGLEKDTEKYAEAMMLGWRVLRVTPKQVQSGQALEWAIRLFAVPRKRSAIDVVHGQAR